jgi:hypothetical protein
MLIEMATSLAGNAGRSANHQGPGRESPFGKTSIEVKDKNIYPESEVPPRIDQRGGELIFI